MKRFSKKYLFLFCLVALLLALTLTACGGNDEEVTPGEDTQAEPSDTDNGTSNDNGSGDEPSEEPGLPEGPKQTFNAKKYTIVYDDKASDPLVDVISTFAANAEEYLGTSLALEVDRFADSTDGKEILIGLSDRSETEIALAKTEGKFTYNISIIDQKICVAAPTIELIEAALNLIMEEYFSKSEGNGKFELPENMDYTPAEFKHLTFVDKGNCLYNVIYPRTATVGTPMSMSAIEIREFLQAHTNDSQEVEILNDYPTGEGGQFDLLKTSIVVGNTLYPRSAEFANGMKYFGWFMEYLDNQYYLYCEDTASIGLMKDKLLSKLTNGIYFKDEKTIRILVPEAESGYYHSWCDEVPQYEPVASEYDKNGKSKIESVAIAEFSEGYFRLTLNKVTKEGYASYIAQVLNRGYTVYQERKTAVDGEQTATFTTYVGSKSVLHIYYLENQKMLRVLMCSKDSFVFYATEPETLPLPAVTKPSMTIMDMDYSKQTLYPAANANEQDKGQDNGLGLIFTLSDGSYIIYDGGYPHDTDKLYNYLVSQNKYGNGSRVRIRAWVLTHPHYDHYSIYTDFAVRYGNDVDLDYVVYQFDYEAAMNPNLADSNDTVKTELTKILKAVKNATASFLSSKPKHIVPMAGQTMYFGDVAIEMLATSEMLYRKDGTAPSNQNDHSIITRVTINGETVLIMADVATPEYLMTTIQKVYGEELKSTFMSAPHHGLNGSTDLYLLVQPKYVIFHTDEKHYIRRLTYNNSECIGANAILIEQLKLESGTAGKFLEEVLYAEGGSYDGYRLLQMPYKGAGYYENNFGNGNYDGGQTDGDNWADITPKAILPKKES